MMKSDVRLHAIGTVDELNALLGIVLAKLPNAALLHKQLTTVQHRLFRLGADLAAAKEQSDVPRMEVKHVQEVEMWIADLEKNLPPLRAFILPGGSCGGALLHHARTVCRRAERHLVELKERQSINPLTIIFLNRLSDYLFLAARMANEKEGAAEKTVEY